MKRTCGTWLIIVTTACALFGIGCHRKTDHGKTEDGAPPPPKYDGPEWPKPGRICDSPFAIVEADGATCNPNIGAGWRIYPRRDVQRPGSQQYKQQAPSPNDPRRSTPSSSPFCVYEWTSKEKLTDDHFSRIKATRECGLAVGMGVPTPAPNPVPPPVPNAEPKNPFYIQNFDRQVKALASPQPAAGSAALQKIDKNAPVVAVLDASPWGVTKADVSGHGYAVSRVVGHLSCIGGADAPGCKDFVRPYVALPLIPKDPKNPKSDEWVPGPDGGYLGYFHDLFDAFEAALADRPKDGHLILNLSLGWDPATTDPKGPEVRHMRGLLERAYCEGVLVIGAAGNGTTTAQAPVLPAALESEWKVPDAKRCKDELGIPDPKPPAAGGYGPLIHAVGSVDLYDERLPTVRAWAHPRLAAYGSAVTVPGPQSGDYFPPRSGTSMSAAAVSGIAAVVWRLKPGLDAAQVMTAVYKGAIPIETKNKASRTELCLDTGRDRCHTWLARRPTLCSAVNAAVGKPILSCVTPVHPEPNDPATAGRFFPPRPPGPPNPPGLNAPCDNTNCGVPLGASPAQAIPTVGPMGVATCGACRLYRNSGNGMMTGDLTFASGPIPFYTTVILYDSSWAPHYYYPFQSSNPNGWFWQGLPSGATHDVIAAEIDWTYEWAGLWLTDGATMQISP